MRSPNGPANLLLVNKGKKKDAYIDFFPKASFAPIFQLRKVDPTPI